jgi:hypothetical protein
MLQERAIEASERPRAASPYAELDAPLRDEILRHCRFDVQP